MHLAQPNLSPSPQNVTLILALSPTPNPDQVLSSDRGVVALQALRRTCATPLHAALQPAPCKV